VPELSDVEGFKRYFNRHAAGRRVERVEVRDGRILRETTPQALGRVLGGQRFEHAWRRGKWLIAPAGDASLLLHFGMTGLLRFTRDGEDHVHDRVVFGTDRGELRYRNMRMFGSVRLASDPAELERFLATLGPDALEVDRERFHELLSGRRRGSLKAALMDQSLIAGLGNLLVDEISWRAHINPGLPVAKLGPQRVDRLHDCMTAVLRESIPRGRIPGDPGWLTGARDDRRSGACPRCGAKLRRATIAGRTTVWCPHCQPRR